MRQALALILTLVAAGGCAPELSTPTRPSAPPPTSAPVEPAPPVVVGDPLAQLAIEGFVVEQVSNSFGLRPAFTLKETSGRHAATIERVDFVSGEEMETYRGTCIRPVRIEAGASWESEKSLYPYCIDGLTRVGNEARIQVWYRDDEGHRGLVVGEWRPVVPPAP